MVRRAEPPTEKEVLQSLALAQMKKINAAKLEETRRDEMLAAGECIVLLTNESRVFVTWTNHRPGSVSPGQAGSREDAVPQVRGLRDHPGRPRGEGEQGQVGQPQEPLQQGAVVIEACLIIVIVISHRVNSKYILIV